METSFAEWLDGELRKRKMRQVDLARKSGVTPAQISRILSGQRGVESKTLLAIAEALKVPPDQAFRAAGLPLAEESEDEWVDEMNYKIKLIAPNLRGVVSAFINSMLDGSESPPRKSKPNHKQKTTTP